MVNNLAFIVAGLALLVLGGEFLVRGAVNMALRLGIAPLIVGLTVVAFGTSAPELIVSLVAVRDGQPGMALGNVVGSNIANILLVLGLPALLAGIVTRDHDLRSSWAIMLAAAVALIAFAFGGGIPRWGGILLFAGLLAMIAGQILTARASRNAPAPEVAVPGATWKRITLWLVVGLVALPVGAKLLVSGSGEIARSFGVSDTVIGLTLVAVGTSLPELATSVAAALRGRADLALGNVIGSNIFNILAILGIAAMVSPLPIPPEMLGRDLWVMLAVSIAAGPFLLRGWPIGRIAGAAALVLYGVYVWMLL